MKRFLFEIMVETPAQAEVAAHDVSAMIHCKLESIERPATINYVTGASVKLVGYDAHPEAGDDGQYLAPLVNVWLKRSCLDCNQIGVYSTPEKARAEKFGYCATTIELELDGPRGTYRND